MRESGLNVNEKLKFCENYYYFFFFFFWGGGGGSM